MLSVFFCFLLKWKLSIIFMIFQDLKEIGVEEADTANLLQHIEKIHLRSVKISDDIPVSYLNNCICIY